MSVAELYDQAAHTENNVRGARMVRYAIESMAYPLDEPLTPERIGSIRNFILACDRKPDNVICGCSHSDPVADALRFLHLHAS